MLIPVASSGQNVVVAGGGGVSLVWEGNQLVSTSTPVNKAFTSGSVGDLCVYIQSATYTRSANLSGFTDLGVVTFGNTAEGRAGWKTLDSTDISNGYITIPGDAGFNGVQTQLWIITGTAPEVDVYASTAPSIGASPNTTNTAPSVTTSADNAIVLCGFGGRPGGTTWSSPSADVSSADLAFNGFVGMYAAHFTKATAGATGSQTVMVDAANTRPWGYTIAVNEA